MKPSLHGNAKVRRTVLLNIQKSDLYVFDAQKRGHREGRGNTLGAENCEVASTRAESGKKPKSDFRRLLRLYRRWSFDIAFAHFHRMPRPRSAHQIAGAAVVVAAPANSLRMLGSGAVVLLSALAHDPRMTESWSPAPTPSMAIGARRRSVRQVPPAAGCSRPGSCRSSPSSPPSGCRH